MMSTDAACQHNKATLYINGFSVMSASTNFMTIGETCPNPRHDRAFVNCFQLKHTIIFMYVMLTEVLKTSSLLKFEGRSGCQ